MIKQFQADDKTSPFITQDLKTMKKWFVSNKLTANVNKCEALDAANQTKLLF